MIGCDTHMCRALFEHRYQRSDNSQSSTYFGPVRVRPRGLTEILPEQLVSAIDDVNLQFSLAHISSYQHATTHHTVFPPGAGSIPQEIACLFMIIIP